jgi:hypothetical protein
LTKRIGLVPTGDRVPYHPACGESLYRLRYPSPTSCSGGDGGSVSSSSSSGGGGSRSNTIIISAVLFDGVKKSILFLYILRALIHENLCFVPIQCINALHMILRRNSYYFAKQHYLTGLCSGYCECFLCGRNVGYSFIFLVLKVLMTLCMACNYAVHCRNYYALYYYYYYY